LGGELDACEGVLSDFRRKQVESWHGLIGPLLESILVDREFALRQVYHDDPKVRFVAISALGDYWKARNPDPFARVCADLALHERDSQIRSIALTYLGVCYESTNDPHIGKILATIVSSVLEPLSCRQSAYWALYTLRGRHLTPSSPRPSRVPKLKVPEEIDWAFVNSFLA
jgi:hypothetical protein